jgi:drug/metabolite transporter (DMT)-like permease
VTGLAIVKAPHAPAGTGLSALQEDGRTLLAIGACLGRTLLYGYAGNQLAAALALALPAALQWPAQPPGLRDWLAAAGLAVLASGLAYILYFRLITQVEPIGAASVTFLVPVVAALGAPSSWPSCRRCRWWPAAR